jgi:hypothetical protein
MTLEQAEEIKSVVDDINKKYAPIRLTFQMSPYFEQSWFVTITYNYTENEWMKFYGMNHNHSQVMDKLSGFIFGLEAVQAYQEEYGDLKFEEIKNSKTL